MTTIEDLARSADAVLLDFDGPVCGVFSGHPNYVVAKRLRVYLEERGVALPPAFDSNRDPLKILRWVGTAVPTLVGAIDDVLTSEETTAVAVARPTSHAHEALRRLSKLEKPTAIVSNNSERAISTYLELHGLTDAVRLVVGREHSQPERMKPAPDLVIRAARELGVPPEACVFIGDSTTDMKAGKTAGVRPVGYAKADRDGSELIVTGAEVVIADMSVLVHALGYA